ncbi:hypothetical protein [Klebsiella quasipneumoniae]|uniref:hypothetical protein n=1 Tax=Klebsiella quasipneumoniae TaxID=1463165 RepID=UPI001FCACD95|nr:hypothetical protein [Klebsiella quasipneumoniae]MCJ5550468.1 hypothetical protein [Klebsiella quasipneumoniae]
MYEIHVKARNVITGEINFYRHFKKYNSPGKAAKVARRLFDDITLNGIYLDENEYTVSVGKVKHV